MVASEAADFEALLEQGRFQSVLKAGTTWVRERPERFEAVSTVLADAFLELRDRQLLSLLLKHGLADADGYYAAQTCGGDVRRAVAQLDAAPSPSARSKALRRALRWDGGEALAIGSGIFEVPAPDNATATWACSVLARFGSDEMNREYVRNARLERAGFGGARRSALLWAASSDSRSRLDSSLLLEGCCHPADAILGLVRSYSGLAAGDKLVARDSVLEAWKEAQFSTWFARRSAEILWRAGETLRGARLALGSLWCGARMMHELESALNRRQGVRVAR
jgi:hypothetical protein